LVELSTCSQKLSDAVDKALALSLNERTQSVDEFLLDIGIIKSSNSFSPTCSNIISLVAFHNEKRCGIWNLPVNVDIAIGRMPSDSNILLNSYQNKISRRHCIIRVDTSENAIFITDYSTLGTCIGSQRLEKGKKYRLSAGDIITLPEGYKLGFTKK